MGKKSSVIFIIFSFLCVLSLFAFAGNEIIPVQLDFFFSPGCTECEHVKTEVIPELEDLFAGQFELHYHDITISENIPLLIAYQELCNNKQNGKVSIVVDHDIFFSGYEVISTGLVECVEQAIVKREQPGWKIRSAPSLTEDEAEEIVKECASTMTFSVVAIGGLVDGLNPCAISTLIFFISILAIAHVDKKIRLMVGISFIAASFIVYTALGLGFVFAIRKAPNFGAIKTIVETIIGIFMIPLAYLSFRDAFRFRKSESPADVTLQIPKKIKTHIHSYMNSRLGVGGPIIGGIVTGAGVTILESVCTGQSYLPVLMYMLKHNLNNLCSWVLLIVYNLLFILPLAVVFVCFHRGMEINSLISWSKRNLVKTKILLGVFFLAMAILLLM